MNLILASSNSHKIEEIRNLFPTTVMITGLADMGVYEPIPETGNTFTANALTKARFVFEKFHLPVVADDSGLEVAALDGRPGVFSARYSGNNATDSDNISLLLKEMEGIQEKKARFVAVIILIIKDIEHAFEGICEGTIATERRGSHGFGYDPVFIPDGYDQTFAELSATIKNQVSHRGKAIRKLLLFLKQSGY